MMHAFKLNNDSTETYICFK